jgi:creatinine amidohydrolase
VQDEILAAYPAGKLPPIEKTTLRDPAELAPYLKEPMSPGWKSVYGLPLVGPR